MFQCDMVISQARLEEYLKDVFHGETMKIIFDQMLREKWDITNPYGTKSKYKKTIEDNHQNVVNIKIFKMWATV